MSTAGGAITANGTAGGVMGGVTTVDGPAAEQGISTTSHREGSLDGVTGGNGGCREAGQECRAG